MANINDRINGQEFESASPLAHAVRYDRAQVKTEEQKKQARENIGCFCEAGGGGGGSSGGGGGLFFVPITIEEDDSTGYTISVTLGKTAGEIIEATKTMQILLVDEFDDQAGYNRRGVFIPPKYGYLADGDSFGFYMTVMINEESFVLEADSADAYPSWSAK